MKVLSRIDVLLKKTWKPLGIRTQSRSWWPKNIFYLVATVQAWNRFELANLALDTPKNVYVFLWTVPGVEEIPAKGSCSRQRHSENDRRTIQSKQHQSVCSSGQVQVSRCILFQAFYSLIWTDDRKHTNTNRRWCFIRQHPRFVSVSTNSNQLSSDCDQQSFAGLSPPWCNLPRVSWPLLCAFHCYCQLIATETMVASESKDAIHNTTHLIFVYSKLV